VKRNAEWQNEIVNRVEYFSEERDPDRYLFSGVGHRLDHEGNN
jgi:hypothetical protein